MPLKIIDGFIYTPGEQLKELEIKLKKICEETGCLPVGERERNLRLIICLEGQQKRLLLEMLLKEKEEKYDLLKVINRLFKNNKG